VLKLIVDFGTLLIGVEGTKTPAGGSPDRPRKAKCLERKSTGNFNRANFKNKIEKSAILSTWNGRNGRFVLLWCLTPFI
jgi:hypothetical protein